MGRSIMISGADGFLGRQLCGKFSEAGWRVFGLIRNLSEKTAPPGLSEAFEYSFPDRIDPAARRVHPDVFIHNAFQTRITMRSPASSGNVEAAKFLLTRVVHSGCRFAFVSSMSAHEGAFSRYGSEKLGIEKMMDLSRHLAIRPGFILGYGGVFRRLVLLLAKLPVIPLFHGSSPIHTIHADDVSRTVLALVERRSTGLWPVGEETPITIRAFYTAIANWLGRQARLLPVPGAPFLYALKAFERWGGRPPLTSENLLGLKGLKAYDLSQTINLLGFRPASLFQSLQRLDPEKVLVG